MAVNDLWQVTLRGTFLSQEVLNVFHYLETTARDPLTTGANIAEWFFGLFATPIEDLLSLSYVVTQVDVAQVTGGVVIGTYVPTAAGGGQGGEPLPSYVAYGFRLNRASAASRHGYKRFPGVSESFVSGNTATPPTGGLAGMISAIETPISDPTTTLDGVYSPVILSRVVNGQPRPTPLGFSFSGVTFLGVTTQNTRKP